MTPTLKIAAVPVDEGTLRRLAAQSGPCVTLLIPGRRPGSTDGDRRVVANDLVRSASQQLHAHKWGAWPSDLLAPLEEFATGLNGDGGDALAVFCAPNFFHVAAVPGIPKAEAIVANHFRLAPLATAVFAPHEFFVLGLNRRNMRLLRYANGRCEDAAWPASVAQNEDAFKGLDKPDHELRNRSASGPSQGSMGAVVFGSGAGNEKRGDYEHDYYLAVDRGLKETVHETPIVLAGLHEEVTEYRRVAKRCRYLDGAVDGNPDHVAPAVFAAGAARAAIGHYHALGEAVLAKYREMPDRARTLSGVRDVWKAAAAGRVHQLCAAEATEVLGDIHNPHSHEDLVNAAIVETLKNGGEVYTLPADRLPAESPVAAVLRY